MIKKFFRENGYAVLKLIGTHVAMSVFGLMVYLPMPANNNLLVGIFGVVTLVFYFFMVNNDIWKVGANDATRTVGGKSAAHPAKGFLIGLVSAIPDFILCGIYLFFWYFQSYEWAAELGITFTFISVLWEGVFMGLTGFLPGPVVFAAAPFIITLFSGVTYILGTKNINILPLEDNPEDAERKREQKKQKKKLSEMLASKKKEDEEEDELM